MRFTLRVPSRSALLGLLWLARLLQRARLKYPPGRHRRPRCPPRTGH
ncbi:CRISPR-associated protein Cas5 [Cupriavidus sp. L7L]